MKKFEVVDRTTGEILNVPMEKALAIIVRNRIESFILNHCGMHPLDVTCSCFFMNTGKVNWEVIRRIIEHKKHPERFFSNSIDYIGEYDFPF